MRFVDLVAGMLGMDGVWLPPPVIEAELVAACAAGQPLACAPDWWDPKRSDGLSLPLLAAAAAARCDTGDDVACVVAGLAETQALPGRPAPWVPTFGAGVARLLAACPVEPRACGEAARALAHADPARVEDARRTDVNTVPDLDAVWTRIDPRPAVLAAQGCTAQDAVSCLLVAESTTFGWWQEASDALPAWEAACAAGSAYACFMAEPTDRDVVTRACASGVAAACAASPTPDLAVLDRACWSRDAASCFALARVEPDPTLAFILARRACADGSGAACTWAGDLARTRAWPDAAAFLGAQPFSSLATWWRAWKDVGAAKIETDWWNIAPVLSEACNSNDEGACVDFALLQHLGLGLNRDPDAAATTLASMCDLGSARACRELDRVRPDPAARQRRCAAARVPYCALPARKSFYVSTPPEGAHLHPAVAVDTKATTLLPGWAKKYRFLEAGCGLRLVVDAPTGRVRSADAVDCHPMLRAISERAGVKSTFVPDPARGAVGYGLRYLFRVDP